MNIFNSKLYRKYITRSSRNIFMNNDNNNNEDNNINEEHNESLTSRSNSSILFHRELQQSVSYEQKTSDVESEINTSQLSLNSHISNDNNDNNDNDNNINDDTTETSIEEKNEIENENENENESENDENGNINRNNWSPCKL
eukprot:248915_1